MCHGVGGIVGQKFAPAGALFDMSKLLLVKSGEVVAPPFRDVKTVET